MGVPEFKSASLEFSCGFNVSAETKYRNGNDFTANEDNGVPYTVWKPMYSVPSLLSRLSEILIDSFYQHRGEVVVGTIVAKLPTSLDTLLRNVQYMMPYDIYPPPAELTYTP